MNKILSISFGPFTSFARSKIALQNILKCNFGSDFTTSQKISDFFQNFFDDQKLEFYISGRVALLKILKTLDLPKGSPVLLQACTCLVLPQAIKKSGLSASWVDIDESTLNIDLDLLEKELIRLSEVEKKAVVITQDNFGIIVDRKRMMALKSKYNFIWIEDIAHSFGNKFDGKYVGTFGDFAFGSFGRDKMMSAISGGFAIQNNKDISLIDVDVLPCDKSTIFRSLVYEVIVPFIKVGPVLWTKFWQKFFGIVGLLPKVVVRSELSDDRVLSFPKAFVPFLEYEIDRWEDNKNGRIDNTKFWHGFLKDIEGIGLYNPENLFIRYPMVWKRSGEFLDFCKKRNVYLGDWYRNIIDPSWCSLEEFGLDKSQIPVATHICPQLMNLPVYSTLCRSDKDRIKELFLEFTQSHGN